MPSTRKATWLHDYSISAHTEQIETTSLLPEYEPNPAWSDNCSQNCIEPHRALQSVANRNFVSNAQWIANDDDSGDGWWECLICHRVLDTAGAQMVERAFLPVPGTPPAFRTFVPGMTEVTVTRRSDGASWSGGAAGLDAIRAAADADDERAFVAALDHSSMFHQLSTGVQRRIHPGARTVQWCRNHAYLHGWNAAEYCTLEKGHQHACIGVAHWWYPGTARSGRLADLPSTPISSCVFGPLGDPRPDEIGQVDAMLDGFEWRFTPTDDDTNDVEDDEMRAAVHHERRDPKHDLEIVTAMLTGMLYGAALSAIARWLRRGRR